MTSIKRILAVKGLNHQTVWLVLGLVVVVMVLEFSTPPEYVFGYLYIGAIVLANSRLSHVATFWITLLSVVLTIANLWIPHLHNIAPATIANRLIVVLALMVTGVLSARNRRYEEAIAKQSIQLQSQEQLTRLREDFASTLTHDLKTPLLGAIATIKAFQDQKFGAVTAIQQQVLDTMIRSHQTTLQLVINLLEVYRNDIEGLILQREILDLGTLAEEAIASLVNLATSRQVSIRLSYENSDFRQFVSVNADSLQLKRVFTNLITNAINHSQRGDRIDIVLSHYEVDCVVKVLDSGHGILEQELPLLFGRFYQGESDRQALGSGLGLYLSRQIIEAHNGIIWAENRQPHGALFGFRIPRYA
jgi:two-component system, NarL family, sensor kinase